MMIRNGVIIFVYLAHTLGKANPGRKAVQNVDESHILWSFCSRRRSA